MSILNQLESYTKENPNTTILFDESQPKGITYAQLDDLSGRVYAYLSDKGIVCFNQSSARYYACYRYDWRMEGRRGMGAC